MLAADIIEELSEVTGECSVPKNLRALTRAVELLANKGLFDPLIGTLDFAIDGGYLVALPRDVKSPIRININTTPSFSRNRLFEFAQNTDGSVDGEEVAFAWADRGWLPISDERHLPGVIKYKSTNAADNGKTVQIFGRDADGREVSDTLVASNTSPTVSTHTYCKVDRVVRQTTAHECYLATGSNNIARYYPDELQPEYRVIKLSKTAADIRMIYRKHTFAITALTDVVPINSAMAVLQAVKAVRFLQQEEYDKANAALTMAVDFVKEEQISRDLGSALSADTEVAGATDSNISTRDSIIVADIYDEACKISGMVGRQQVLDRITDAVEVLANRGNWDAMVGYCDLVKSANENEVNPMGKEGNGYFVLPNYVGSVLSINLNGRPAMPRNKWFEFHMNGWGFEQNYANDKTWDDAGETVVLRRMPLDADTRKVIPQRIFAVCDNSLDNDAAIRVYGYEIVDGIEKRVMTGDLDGFLVPCKNTLTIPGGYTRKFSRIERITKPATKGFVKLFILKEDNTLGDMLGYYTPAETEPKYRLIKVAIGKEARIRIRYRRRFSKLTSLLDPIHLRSRQGVITMLRALEIAKTDPNASSVMQGLALKYVSDQQWSDNPTQTGSLQFDEGTMPGVTDNIQ